MLITNKPEALEARAEVLEKGAVEIAARAKPELEAAVHDMQSEAALLRDRAAALRKRRTDGVRIL